MFTKNKDNNKNVIFLVDIDVNADDLHTGTPRLPKSCPVARQISRAVKKRFRRWEIQSIDVGRRFVTLVVRTPSSRLGEAFELIGQLPYNAQVLIDRVDSHLGGTPGAYGSIEFGYNLTRYAA